MGSTEGKEADEWAHSSGSWSCVHDDEFDALWVQINTSREQPPANQSLSRSINFKPKPVDKYPGKFEISLQVLALVAHG
jgi:hypothetical protein